MLTVTETKDSLECPKCGKKVLVQESKTKYSCLWCNFSRDLTRSEKQVDGAVPLFAILAMLTFILLL